MLFGCVCWFVLLLGFVELGVTMYLSAWVLSVAGLLALGLLRFVFVAMLAWVLVCGWVCFVVCCGPAFDLNLSLFGNCELDCYV